jgi:SOS regulatory protein LexA
MKKNLTKKQNLVFSAIKSFVQKKGVSPTLNELKNLVAEKKLELKSINSLVQYLDVLERKEYIERFSKARGIRVLEKISENFIEIPLLGRADCGEALSFADDYIEDYINLSSKFIKGDANNYFFIKAVGNSMNKSKINNGDLVLVKKLQEKPHLNNIVVAVINGLGTIKKFQKIDEAPVLLPDSTNANHQPIILHPEDQINICGKVERVFNFSTMEK